MVLDFGLIQSGLFPQSEADGDGVSSQIIKVNLAKLDLTFYVTYTSLSSSSSGTMTDYKVFGPIGIAGTNILATFITTSMTRILTRVAGIHLYVTGSPTGNLNLRLVGDTGGVPDETKVIETATIPATSVINNTAHRFDFTKGSVLPAGTYWFVLEAPSCDTSNCIRWRRAGAGGTTNKRSTDGGSTWAASWIFWHSIQYSKSTIANILE